MAPALTEPAMSTTVRDRVLDSVGRAAHIAHEARLLKTLATDAVEDGIHAASRAVTRGAHEIEDVRDAAAYRIKRAPFTSVAAAAGVGLLLGMVCGWFGRIAVRRTAPGASGADR